METPGFAGQNLKSAEIQILTKKIQVVAMITWIAKDGNK
jgi:hypothetical protein